MVYGLRLMTQPYFYIIQHKASKKKYAGCRFQKGCHHSELLTDGGYLTSSNSVKKILLEEGADAFEIIEIVEVDNSYAYETNFLVENKCAESEDWINQHNNTVPPPYGSAEFNQLMLDKYGVTHNTSIPEVRAQMTKTQLQTHKDNPEALILRAIKIATNRYKNGTTTKGIKRPNYQNNGATGKWVREDKHKQQISERALATSLFVTNNPMNDPEKRKLVGASKLGRHRYYNQDRSTSKYCLPGTEPDGWMR